MSSTVWCELAWLGGAVAEQGVIVEIDGGHITRVDVGVATPPTGAWVRRGLTLPGLANAHSHAFHRVLRGRTHHGAGSFWTWRDQMYAAAAGLDPESCHRLARAVFGEMLLAGFTVVGELHYLHHGPGGVPYADPNAMGEALVTAASEVGIRLTLLDTCYLHGGIGRELNEVQRRFADADVSAWAERVDALDVRPGLRLGAAVHSVRACTPDEIAAVAEWAIGRGVPLHAHVSERAEENQACLAAYGATPTGVLGAAGALGEDFTAVHATHVTDADIALLGSGHVCLCPTTERDLADGVGPAGALRAGGARLAIGSDSQAFIDPFEEARAVELDERLITSARGATGVADLLGALTTNGHRSLGWPDAGRLQAGCRADLVTVSLDSVRLAGARAVDAPASVVFSASPADVTHVVVDGREVVADGRHTTIDVAAELRAVLA